MLKSILVSDACFFRCSHTFDLEVDSNLAIRERIDEDEFQAESNKEKDPRNLASRRMK